MKMRKLTHLKLHTHIFIKDLEHEAVKRITFVFQMDYLRFDDIFVCFVTYVISLVVFSL